MSEGESLPLVPALIIIELRQPQQRSHLVFLLSAWPRNDFWKTPLFFSLFWESTYLYLICHRNVFRSFILLLCPSSFSAYHCTQSSASSLQSALLRGIARCCSPFKENANDRTVMYFHVHTPWFALESIQVHIQHAALKQHKHNAGWFLLREWRTAVNLTSCGGPANVAEAAANLHSWISSH